VGYNAVADNMGLFIYLAAVAWQICEIVRNSPKIRNSSSRSSNIIDLGVDGKLICNSLIAVQVHPRSTILVSIERAYATSY